MLALTLHHRLQPALTRRLGTGYASSITANSVIGIDSPESQRRTSAAIQLGALFMPLWRLCVGGFGLPGSFVSGLSTRVQSPPLIDSDAGDSDHKGVSTMAPFRLFPRNPSARAAAHKAMAKAALFADSSAAVRLKRFNAHMQKARRLEAVAARGQEVVS